MAARVLIGLALALASAAAGAEEPTFITKSGKVIAAPADQPRRGKKSDDAAATDKPVIGGRVRGKQCIAIKAIKAESAETSASLIFHAKDGGAWRNRLPAPCDGLMDVNNLGQLGLKGKDGQLCAGDAVWMKHGGVQSALGIDGNAGEETCALGSFEKISEMSLSEFLRR